MSYRQSTKPFRWTLSPALVDPKWRGFYRGLHFCMPFWEFGVRPLVYYDGISPRDVITVNGAPVWTSRQAGMGVYFDKDNGDVYHIANDDLPASFPGKAVAHYTMLILVQLDDPIGGGDSYNILQKDSASNRPYFLYSDDTQTVNATIDPDLSVNSTGTIPTGEPILIGSSWDGQTLRTILGGHYDGSGATTAMSTNTGPLNIATRTSSHGGATRSLEGTIFGLYAWDHAKPEDGLVQLQEDPFGPFRMKDEAATVYAVPSAVDERRPEMVKPLVQPRPIRQLRI